MVMRLLKRKILFALASSIDYFNANEGFLYFPYKFLYFCLASYKKSSLRSACSQLLKLGELDKIQRNKNTYWRLTSKGRERLLSFFPQSISQRKVWDNTWRIVILSKIANSRENRRLKYIFKQLGLKKFSSGVYISPLAITQQLKYYLLKANFSAKIAVIESRKLILADDQQLARQIWPLDKISLSYKELITKINNLLKLLKNKKYNINQAKTLFSPIFDFYFSLLESDPGLPKKLLPSDWPAFLAKEKFIKLMQEINRRII